MDYSAPSDADLASMTEEELLGRGSDPDDLFAGLSVEHPAARYPVCLGEISREEAEELLGPAEWQPRIDFECWIDLGTRTMHYGLRCTCIRPDEVAADCAGEA